MAEQNSYDFWTRYSNLCLKCRVCPLKSVIKHMRGTKLCFPVERIRSEHWQFLLSALSVDNSLTEVSFKSDLPSLEEQKELWKKRRRKKDESYPCPYGYSPQNISDICKYSARLLTVSQTLQTLIIENLPITKEDAQHLAEGLKSPVLKEFALRCYPYPDEVIEIVCRGLWNSNIFLLDFSSCNLSLVGLGSIQHLIEKHKSRRSVEAFPDTLRYRMPAFEDMMGLTRLILNGNNIGNKGVEMICKAISDDLWILALDLQYCGITNDGAKTLLQQIAANKSMQVVDLRLNKIDVAIVERITIQLGVNNIGKIINYTHLPLWKPKSFSKALPLHKSKLKTKVSKRYPATNKVLKKEAKNYPHAVRISCEIIETKGTSTKDAMVQTDTDQIKFLKDRMRNLELTMLKEASSKDLLVEMSEKLKTENVKLRHINRTLRQENFNLRQEVLRCSTVEGAILIDQDTYDEVRHVFEKFQRFLKLMKDNGLWGLVSTIGVAEYENTRLKAVPSDSRVRFVEKEFSPADGCSDNVPLKVPLVPKLQRCCSCHKPDCISNQKAEKEHHSSNENFNNKDIKEKPQPKNIVDKAKVAKIFKELRETCTSDDFEKQMPPKLNLKHSLGDLPASLKYKQFPLKSRLNKDIPSKFKQIKTPQDLYEAVRSEMEKLECACHLHKASHIRDKSSQSAKNHANVNSKSCFKHVSSQTAAESTSNYRGQKINPDISSRSTSSGTMRKSETPSNSSSSTIKSLGPNNVQAKNMAAKELSKNVLDCNIESRGMAAGVDDFSNSVLAAAEYFKTLAISKDHDYAAPGFSKEPAQSKGRSKSNSSENTDLFSNNSDVSEQRIKINKDSGTSDGSNASEKKIKTKSNQNSSKSYLESISDASTDKDVKSITFSEICESVGSERLSSLSSNKKSEIKDRKVANESGDNQRTDTNSSANPSDKNSSMSNSSKSSKKSQKQKKKASLVRKISKENVSGPSVPSLSDITTVSSHSLNTDLVMDKLSETEKGLS